MSDEVEQSPGRRRGRGGFVSRLSIRGKLLLLLVLPLGAAALTAGPFVAVRAFDAASAGQTADSAASTRSIAVLVGELQAERLLLSSFIASPRDDGTVTQRQQRTVDETVERVRAELGPDISDELASALVRIGSLQEVRDIAAGRGVSPDRVARSYNAAIEALIDALRLVSRQDTDDAQGARQLNALDALLRADEFAELRDAALIAAAVDPESGRPLLDDSDAQAGLFVDRFVQQADNDLAGIVVGVTESQSAQDAAALADRLPDPADPGAVEAFSGEAVQVVGQLSDARQDARERVTALIATSALDRANTAGITAWAVGIGTALLILLVAGLSVLVSRSIATPLRRLTEGARDVTELVANLAEQELTNVSDSDQRTENRVPQPAQIEVVSDDELGRLTAAFNRMRNTAVGLIERQIITRQNVSLMFANVAQRTQNLVGRQLALVDELERNEQDSRMLASLYRLDHLSTRLRRNADNLLVIAGARDEIGMGGPTDLSTALRAALAQIEDYKRVQISDPPELRIGASLGADLVLLFAELLENATAFSPRSTSVEVEVIPGDDGSWQVLVVDHGMGMPPERLAEENRRLVERERLDVTPTTVLGLFVVGRISRRHALSVELVPTSAEGGVTAQITIPAQLIFRPTAPVPAEKPPTAFPAVVIPPARDNGPFTWFADDPAPNGRSAPAGAGAGGFGPRASRPPNGVPRHGAPAAAPPAPVATGSGNGSGNGNGNGNAHGNGNGEGRNGLRRRVAGAQLPDTGRSASPRADRVPEQRRPHHDPAAARSRFGEFEEGFNRAAAATSSNGPPPPAGPPRPSATGAHTRPPSAPVNVPRPAAPQGSAPQGLAAPDGAPPSVQRAGLTRRTPGANMAPELRSRPAPRRGSGEQVQQRLRDPGLERTQFDAFQDAVNRSAHHDPTKETTA